jgi:HEPN domain-containing protein
VNRSELQQLAEIRLSEAQVLLDAGKFAGAYYLAGYAIECALKACIAKQVREFDFPDKKLVQEAYTHDLGQLLRRSGVNADLDEAMAHDPRLDDNWTTVKDWNEASRYKIETNEASATIMLVAVGDASSGVLTWLKTFW